MMIVNSLKYSGFSLIKAKTNSSLLKSYPGTYRFMSLVPNSKESKLSCNLLQNHPSYIPKTNAIDKMKTIINHRAFSSKNHLLSYYRDPKNSIVGDGIISRLWSRIPDSIKLISLIGGFAYLVIFVAVPILVMILPPIIIGGWLFFRINKYFREKEMKRRWENIEKSTLIYYPKNLSQSQLFVPPPDQINNELANFEINRIIDAFWSNEQNINNYFKIEDIDDLALGTLEAIQYSYNNSSVLFADDFKMMVIQQRPLYDRKIEKELANVTLTLKCLNKPMYEDTDPSANISKSLVEIEIVPTKLFAKPFVLNTPSVSTKNRGDDDDTFDGNDDDSDFDGIIDVKGKTKIL